MKKERGEENREGEKGEVCLFELACSYLLQEGPAEEDFCLFTTAWAATTGPTSRENLSVYFTAYELGFGREKP